jgi:hypothetical protein
MLPERCGSATFADQVGSQNKRLKRATSISVPLMTGESLRVHRRGYGPRAPSFRTINHFRQIAPSPHHRIASAR